MKIFKTRTKHKEIADQLLQQNNLLNEASSFIKEIESGNLDMPLSERMVQSTLGKSLLGIKAHLLEIKKGDNERNWFNTGLANFSDILRNKESKNLAALSDEILKNIVQYLGANQGAIFVLNEEGEGKDPYLEMISCYAYEKKKYVERRINLGEGLVGQCVLEKDMIYLKKTPDDYVRITSGLGQATPKEVLIMPLLINEKSFGVIELASFQEFPPYKIDFLKKLSENIAAAIKNVKEGDRILTLLHSSQEQAEELRAQEEEMRQNMEELQATQEEMKRKSDEIAQASAEMISIKNGIDASMATIEFTPDGLILTANPIFLKVTGYKISELKGRHHKQLVPQEIVDSEDYKKFWSRLAAGESFTGIFKRLSAEKKTIWLNAVYNPILNAKGEVAKVVKFATDVTEQQERISENQGLISGMNATMALIEFAPDGNILTANENFTQAMKYSLDEIKGKHHSKFVPKEILDSPDYKTFWKRLSSGESISGIFKRIDSSGKTVWLNAIYNPILNANKDVVKVIKFATDITKQQELLAEIKGTMEGIEATMATIEFKPDGTIVNANKLFLKSMKYTLDEIKGEHHRKFVPMEIRHSESYKQFWLTLASGKSTSGVFKRVASDNSVVLLNAIYNPILDTEGKVVKVLKFATDITASRKMLEEMDSGKNLV